MARVKTIDLNVDLGEGFPWDRQLLEFASSANVCCGVHAGSVELALETVMVCDSMGVRAGAHPGYPDRKGFGRRGWELLEEGLRGSVAGSVLDQVRGLEGKVAYLKPHGGFYNDSARGGDAAEVLALVLTRFGLPLMGLEGSFHESVSRTAGVSLIREGFADRRYTEDGFLVPRSEAGAVLGSVEEKVEQALWLAERVDSICLHGDEVDSVETIRAVRSALEERGYLVTA